MHRSLYLISLILFLSRTAYAQTPQAAPAGTAAISGQVKMGEQPASGIAVALYPDQLNSRQPAGPPRNGTTSQRTTTDETGKYRFANLAPGGYRLMLLADAYVTTGAPRGGGISINVSDAQIVENHDFTIARGGVISGRVTDHSGRPVIAERINLSLVNDAGQAQAFNTGPRIGFESDDRGIYRIYGIPAGRYLVSAGIENDQAGRGARPGQNRRIRYPRTFHPEAIDQSLAEPVDVTPGAVKENIDIRMGAPLKTFAVIGRAIDAETSEPVPGVSINVVSNQRGPAMVRANPGSSNSEGEFRISGLLPGKYSLTVRTNNLAPDETGDVAIAGSEFYSEPANFEISGEDATGVEIKVHRGASITGIVLIEGVNDPATRSRLTQMIISANVRVQQQQGQRGPGASGGSGRSALSAISPDGSFRLSGLSPGNVRLNINGGGFGGPGEFKLLRIERNGAPLNGDLSIAAGESIGGIRLVLGRGVGVIAGRVLISGGTLPPGMRLSVTARPLNSTIGGQGANARLEANGEFRIENLLPGSYEVRVRANGGANGGRGGRRGENTNGTATASLPEVREVVSVANAAPANVTLRLNLAQ